jgi:lysyl-tRNA synthetase class 2
MTKTNDNGNDKKDITSSENDLIAQRRAELQKLRAAGWNYPNHFRRDALAASLLADHSGRDPAELEHKNIRVKIAGRMMTRRVMGKAAFAHLQDMSGRMQVYVRRDDVPEGQYDAFKHWDLGDILGAEGKLFKTRTGELSVHVDHVELLAKSLRPLPEKFHGLTDHEIRYRQRYLDLITNEETRSTFATRSATIDFIRAYLKNAGFLEVETPMMQVIPGGATARPFVTHHNALDMELYLRIAPELYLKRLVVGGIEKVFEINRSFRNEGLSPKHNPEFTMLEFYQAYVDYQDLMVLTEDMLRKLVQEITGNTTIKYQGETYDFAQPFPRMTVAEAVMRVNKLDADDVKSLETLCAVARKLDVPVDKGHGAGRVLIEIFDKTVEPELRQPTFITAFPIEVSPLARRTDQAPEFTDRFELFIGGREIANGFSELNDPEDQAARFRKQAENKAAGDLEAMHYDEDYVTALEYGMPPTAGEGIGIDRLVMLLTDSFSIRDVILFPHMRPR